MILGRERDNAIALLYEIDLFRIALEMEQFHERLEKIDAEAHMYGRKDSGVVKLMELLQNDAKMEGYEFIPDPYNHASGFCKRIPLREDQILESIVLEQARIGYISMDRNLIPLSNSVVANYVFSISRGLHLLLSTGGFWNGLIGSHLPEVAEPTARRASGQGLFTRMIKKVVPWGNPRNR